MKSFPVSKMPWHTDDHKFGESSEGLDRAIRELEERMGGEFKVFKPLPPPPIDEALAHRLQYVADTLVGIPMVGTVCLIDEGRCHVCGEEAVYAFRSKLYCPTCWLAMRDDEDDY